jgi:hypothetical protein
MKKAGLNPQNPAPRGRDLEELVSLLERALASSDVSIKSRDSIPDRDTREPREVDVAVRFRAGSVEALVIFECRDRSRKQDATWIEQLAQIARSIEAARAVAVSRSGFSRPAVEKAAALNIDLRMFRDLTPATILDTLRIRGVMRVVPRTEIVAAEAHFGVESEENAERVRQQLGEKRKIAAPDLCWATTGQPCSVLDVWNRLVAEAGRKGVDLHDAAGVPSDGSPIRRRFVVNIRPAREGHEGVVLPVAGGSAPLLRLVVDAELRYQLDELRPGAAHSYCSPDSVFVETLEYPLDMSSLGGAREVLSVHRVVATGEVGLSRRSLDGLPLVAGRFVAADATAGTGGIFQHAAERHFRGR